MERECWKTITAGECGGEKRDKEIVMCEKKVRKIDQIFPLVLH